MAALLIGTLCGCSGNTIHSTDFSAADTYSVPAGGYLNDLDPSLDLSTVAATPEQLACFGGAFHPVSDGGGRALSGVCL